MLAQRIVMAAGVLVLALTATAAEANYASLEQAKAAALEQHKPLLIDFSTEW